MKKDWELRHLGFVVHDLDRAINYYQSLGIGTVGPERIVTSGGDTKSKMRFFHIGSLEIAFLQPLEGESKHLDFLRNRGEGIQHIAFIVDDFEKESAALIENGSPVVLSGKEITGEDWALFDTRKVGNVIIELCGPPAK